MIAIERCHAAKSKYGQVLKIFCRIFVYLFLMLWIKLSNSLSDYMWCVNLWTDREGLERYSSPIRWTCTHIFGQYYCPVWLMYTTNTYSVKLHQSVGMLLDGQIYNKIIKSVIKYHKLNSTLRLVFLQLSSSMLLLDAEHQGGWEQYGGKDYTVRHGKSWKQSGRTHHWGFRWLQTCQTSRRDQLDFLNRCVPVSCIVYISITAYARAGMDRGYIFPRKGRNGLVCYYVSSQRLLAPVRCCMTVWL